MSQPVVKMFYSCFAAGGAARPRTASISSASSFDILTFQALEVRRSLRGPTGSDERDPKAGMDLVRIGEAGRHALVLLHRPRIVGLLLRVLAALEGDGSPERVGNCAREIRKTSSTAPKKTRTPDGTRSSLAAFDMARKAARGSPPPAHPGRIRRRDQAEQR